MNEAVENHPESTRPPKLRASGRARRRAILEAALRLIAREGVRSVRHRAVAAEAGVPLSATTYYFKDITTLLREAFEHFAALQDPGIDTFRDDMLGFFARAGNLRAMEMDDARAMCEEMASRLSNHIIGEAAQHERRALLMAFKDESVRDPSLGELMRERERRLLGYYQQALEVLGSTDPAIDAQIVFAIVQRLEIEAAFNGMDAETVHSTLRRHVLRMIYP